MRAPIALAALLAGLGPPQEAFGAEGEAFASLDGAAGLSFDGAGLSLGSSAGLWVGLDEWLWLAGSAGVAIPDGREASIEALAGLAVALDVLAFVPWTEALFGAAFAPGAESLVAPAARVSLGIDWLLDRHWSVGAFVRAHFGPGELGGPRLLGGVRVGYRFEP